MGSYLIILSDAAAGEYERRLFLHGLSTLRQIQSRKPSFVVEMDWVRAATFARLNGTIAPFVTDGETGTWLLAAGTWFDGDNHGAGEERWLLRRYLDRGPMRLAEELEGFFAIAIGDARTRELFIITDLNGSCHCYRRSWKNAVAISNSSLALARLGDFSLDPVGCQEFLCSGTVFEDRTLYREICKLAPATVFSFNRTGLLSSRRYWHLGDADPESLDGQNAVHCLGDALIRAVQKVGRIYPRPVCDLTGGYDSRALVAAFLSAGVRFSTVVSGRPDHPDVRVSKGLAKSAGLEHAHIWSEQPLNASLIQKSLLLTDGEFDVLEYAGILRVHEILSERFDISINGSYGGIARGLWWELLLPHVGAPRKLDARKLARARYAAGVYDPRLFPPEIRLDLADHYAGVIERINQGLSHLPNTAQMDYANLSLRIHRWQGRIASSTNRIWPCLSIFGLRSVLETVLRTRASLRQQSMLVRRMLAEYQPGLARYPMIQGYPAMPARWNNIHRFWPVPVHFAARLLRKGSRMIRQACGYQAAASPDQAASRLRLWQDEGTQELLNSEKMRAGNILDPEALTKFLQQSRSRSFSFEAQWARLFTLETTLCFLDSLRADSLPAGAALDEHLAQTSGTDGAGCAAPSNGSRTIECEVP